MMGCIPEDIPMLILAGGLGTRLSAVVNHVPKPMAPVRGRPFLAFLLDYWMNEGVTNFVISIGHKAEIIRNYFGISYGGARITYIQENSPLGTGGAIKKVLNECQWLSPNILVANGDTWFEIDLHSFHVDAKTYGKPVTVALKEIEYNVRYSGVLYENGIIREFGINAEGRSLINGGCYLLDIKFLIELMQKFSGKFSFEQDVLEKLAVDNKIAGSIQNGNFLDIGIPIDYQNAKNIIDIKGLR